jgi:branched-chain amino acid transport system ATP-binding protein
MSLLELKGIGKSFGGLAALRGVDLSIEKDEIVGLIGPNGAGKTTLFNVISGVFRPSVGTILYRGKDITRWPMHRIASYGLVRTFQQTELFMEMSALQNVRVGQHVHHKIRAGDAGKTRKQNRHDNGARELVEFVGLGQFADELAENLPHGHRRALGVAIALAAAPQLLLLDEPLTGMDAEETLEMVDIIKRIRSLGTTIMIVEHNMRAVMRCCDRIAVLNFGQKIAEGAPKEIQNHPEVIDAYLGVDEAIHGLSNDV